MRAGAAWTDARHDNVLDGGAPFYRCYRTADGGHVAVGAIEANSYHALLGGLGLSYVLDPAAQMDKASWPATHARLEAAFLARTRDEWAAHFAGTDACVTPVLTFAEAPSHPQNAGVFAAMPGGWAAPRTSPRFSDPA